MISQVPRNLRFGNADDIEWLHKWQSLSIEQQQMLRQLESPKLSCFEVRIIGFGSVYEVTYRPKTDSIPRMQTARSVTEVYKTIDEFELEHRIMRAGM